MTSTEMELRVARALYEVEGGPGQTPWESDTLKSYRENVMYKKARAAIRAMREPTGGMVEKGGIGIAIECQGFSHAAKIVNYSSPEIMAGNMMKASAAYQAMINAASPTTDGDK